MKFHNFIFAYLPGERDVIYHFTPGSDIANLSNYQTKLGLGNDVEKYKDFPTVFSYFSRNKDKTLVCSYISDNLQKEDNENGRLRGGPEVCRILVGMENASGYIVDLLNHPELVALKSYDDQFVSFSYENNESLNAIKINNHSLSLIEEGYRKPFVPSVVHDKQFYRLLTCLVYILTNEPNKTLDIIYHSPSEYEKAKQILVNLIKFLPLKIANSVSFSTVSVQGAQVQLRLEGDQNNNMSKSISIHLKRDEIDIVNYPNEAKGDLFGFLEGLDGPTFSYFASTYLNNKLDGISSIESFVKYIECLKLYSLIKSEYETSDIFNYIENISTKLLENASIIDNYFKDNLNSLLDNFFKNIEIYVNSCQRLEDNSIVTLLQLVSNPIYKEQYKDVVYHLVYSSLIYQEGDAKVVNRSLLDELISNDSSKDFVNNYFVNNIFEEDFSEISLSLSEYIRNSINASFFVDQLTDRIITALVLNRREKIELAKAYLQLLDEVSVNGFRNVLEISVERFQKVNRFGEFFLDYIAFISAREINTNIKDFEKTEIYQKLKIINEICLKRDGFSFLFSYYFENSSCEYFEHAKTMLMEASIKTKSISDSKHLYSLYEEYVQLSHELKNNENIHDDLILSIYTLVFKDKSINLVSLFEKLSDELIIDDSFVEFYLDIAKKFGSQDLYNDLRQCVDTKKEKYENFKTRKQEEYVLSEFRIDFVVGRLKTIGDRGINAILNKYLTKPVVEAKFAEGNIQTKEEDERYLGVVEELARNYLTNPEVKDEDKIKFVRAINKTIEDNRFSSMMTFSEFSSLIIQYVIIVSLFAIIDLIASIIVAMLLFSGGYVSVPIITSLLHLVFVTVLFFQNSYQRMFRKPILRTLWQGLIIFLALFGSMVGIIMIF